MIPCLRMSHGPAPPGRAGRRGPRAQPWRRRPGRAPAERSSCRVLGAGPDQRVGPAALVGEEAGVERRRQARVVDLDREVFPLLRRDLGPSGSDLGLAEVDAVGGSVLVRPVVHHHDRDLLALIVRVAMSPVKPVSVWVKVPMVAMIVILVRCSLAAPLRPRWRSSSRRRPAPHLLCRPQQSGGRRGPGFLVREEPPWRRGRKPGPGVAVVRTPRIENRPSPRPLGCGPARTRRTGPGRPAPSTSPPCRDRHQAHPLHRRSMMPA